MITRNLFTTRRNWDTVLDVALAVFIGLALTFAALAYFDVLVP